MHFCFISGAPKHTLKLSHSELDRGTLTLGTPNPALRRSASSSSEARRLANCAKPLVLATALLTTPYILCIAYSMLERECSLNQSVLSDWRKVNNANLATATGLTAVVFMTDGDERERDRALFCLLLAASRLLFACLFLRKAETGHVTRKKDGNV